MIDLRSDTVTQPTAAMRRAMAEAEVGDDVYGEDPTVNRLEQQAAAITGKQAALFVPTGIMGNQIAVKLHTEHGQEVICEARGHLMDWELAMMAWFSGVVPRTIAAENGILTWPQVQREIRPVSPHAAPTGLVSLENTHNMAGGTVSPVEITDEVCHGAHNAGLPVHMDGARIFNAAVACGQPVARLVQHVDTVMFCLSKGLCAPVGSLLAGTHEAIAKGRLYRKRLGGGMRQAGVLAAAGLLALEEMPARLHEDHSNARLLAEGLTELPGVALASAPVQTNIVVFDVAQARLTPMEILAQAREQGVLLSAVGGTRLRAVTHKDVSAGQCRSALAALQTVLTA